MTTAESALAARSTTPWYRQFWPWFLIALPAISVVFSFATLFVALRNADSLVRDDYYDAGLAINREFAREHVAAARHLKAVLRVDPATLSVQLRLTGAALNEPAALTLQLTHPTHAERDRTVILAPTPSGAYVGQLDVLPRGDWHVVVRPSDGDWSLAERLDLTLPGEHTLQAGS